MFQMLGVFAEFERALIRERVMAGLARAKKTGTKSGKPFGRPRVEAAVEALIRKSLLKGEGTKATATAAGVGIGTVLRVKADLATE